MAGKKGSPHANAGSFQKGNQIGRHRVSAQKKEIAECLMEGVRLAEQGIYRVRVKDRLNREGKTADEVNKILDEMEDMPGRESLIHFWRRLAEMSTDSAMKIIAERLMPKAKLPATYVASRMDEKTAKKIGAMMLAGEMPPDVAQAMISAINGISELEERQLMIRMTTLQIEAIQKGLMDPTDDEE